MAMFTVNPTPLHDMLRKAHQDKYDIRTYIFHNINLFLFGIKKYKINYRCVLKYKVKIGITIR